MLKRSLIAASVIATLAGCSSIQDTNQNTVDLLAHNLDINYQLVTNHGADKGLECGKLGAEWASCNQYNINLTNNGEAVTSTDWTIYFHSIRLILDVQNDQFKITRITGDLHKLEPTDKFKGFAANEKIVIPVIGEFWTLFDTDFMPNAFVTAPDAEPKVIESLNTEDVSSFVLGIEGENLKRVATDNNVVATPTSRFDKNADVKFENVTTTLIPTPMQVEASTGSVSIVQGIKLPKDAFPANEFAALKDRADVLGLDIDGKLPVSVKVTPKAFKGEFAKAGAYDLNITKDGIQITAFDDSGAFYAVQSIYGLLNSESLQNLPLVKIKDVPRYDYRGIMVDVARNFHSKEAMLATIDQMAAYKMNKLHLHLSDDEGWRLEIPGLPELTDIGSKRCFDLDEKTCLLPQLGSGHDSNNFGSGFFSRADFIEILKYAAARNVDVIPEIDMPAHARAAVMSMEARYDRLMAEGKTAEANEYRLTDPEDTSNVTTVQFYDKHSFINPCLDSSSRFVDKVITEVDAMYKEAGLTLDTWHFGGDEAKNIRQGAAFQDRNATDKVAWKGDIDTKSEHKPFEKSPQCQTLIAEGVVSDSKELPSYFAAKVSKIAADKGIPAFQAWQDGLKYSKDSTDFATGKTRVNFWDTLYWGGATSAYEWSKKGYDVIISNPDYVYMDFPYEVDPKERGYYWATRATDTRKMFAFAPENLPQNAETSVDRDGNGFIAKGEVVHNGFAGLSAQLWSETVRTDEQYEYMVFPRVLAAAERAWHKADWEIDYTPGKEYSQKTSYVNKAELLSDWTRFANVLGQRELAKLEKSGIDYRMPLPGAEIIDGKLSMNISFPGVAMQYSFDNKEWKNYDANAKPSVTGEVFIRSVSASGDKFSRVTSLK